MEMEAKPKASIEECNTDIQKWHAGNAAPKPAVLQHLSDEDLENLEKRLRRKIDVRLLPCMILIYIMNYLDR